jgi:hypothetical protein
MEMTNRPPVNPSALTEGWHPGYLIHISEEPTPPDWQMAKQSPTMYRWHFTVWEVPTLVDRQAPEVQSGLTSTKFSPKGRFQASKAYTWACQMLGRQIAPGETVNWETLYPVPCRLKVTRDPGKDYVKIVDVEAWTDGQQHLPTLATALAQARAALLAEPAPRLSTPPASPGTPPVPPPTPQAPQPGLQTWGGQGAQPVAAGSKPSW